MRAAAMIHLTDHPTVKAETFAAVRRFIGNRESRLSSRDTTDAEGIRCCSIARCLRNFWMRPKIKARASW